MSVTDRVFWLAAEQVLATARMANLDERLITRGLDCESPTMAAKRWIPWDHYCIMLDRVEQACGGPESLEQLCAQHVAFNEVRALASSFLSPAQLYAFIFRVLDPFCFPCVRFDYRELDDGRLRIGIEVQPDVRGSMALMRGTVGALRAVPTHLGLPLATVEANLDAHRSLYFVRPPTSQTILARARRRTKAALDSMTTLLGEMANEQLRPVPPTERTAPGGQGAAGEALLDIRARYGLSDRQFDVLQEIIAGCGNKEIAQRLGCAESTVELHVTALLRKVGVKSRAQLTAKYWTDMRAQPLRRVRS